MNFLQPEEGSRGPSLSRWARLRLDVSPALRHGQWYPVLSVGTEEVVLEAGGAPTVVARAAVELVTHLGTSRVA